MCGAPNALKLESNHRRTGRIPKAKGFSGSIRIQGYFVTNNDQSLLRIQDLAEINADISLINAKFVVILL